jgi:hypothetical protein
MSGVPPTPKHPSEQRVISDVQEYGWHIIHVGSDSRGSGWSFSIGLFHTFRHPEFVVMGLPSATTQLVINELGARVKAGEHFAHGQHDPDVLTGYEVQFVSVSQAAYREHLGYACWFYRGERFPVLQAVWPDRAGVFPWQAGFDPSLVSVEPVLGVAT